MAFKSVFIIFAGFVVFQPAYAATTIEAPPLASCVANKAEYLKRLSEFPKLLQGIDAKPNGKMYRLAGLKRLAANAAIKLRIADNNKFIFDVAVAAPGKLIYEEENYISKICIKDNKISLFLENSHINGGMPYVAKMNESDSFDLEGGNFKETTAADFAKEVEKVKAELNDGHAPAPQPASGGRDLPPPPLGNSGRK